MLLVLAVVGIYLAAGEALVDALSLILQVGGISLAASIAFLCLIGVLYAGWLAYQRAARPRKRAGPRLLNGACWKPGPP
ncbi:MAG: hypothetical protein HS126_03360 [Anaerolineales bacterium]|nr:hypothetical protein [Anaerolineales bacterium]